MLFQAGGMERAQRLPKIRDAEKESLFGYVYAVSGPGMFQHPDSITNRLILSKFLVCF